MYTSFECCVMSGRGLCVGQIPCPEKFYRVCMCEYVCLCEYACMCEYVCLCEYVCMCEYVCLCDYVLVCVFR